MISKQSRRGFLSFAAKAAAVTGITTLFGKTSFAMAPDKVFIHHVYFWLKNPDSQEDKEKLIEALKKLSKVKTIKEFHIGLPSSTNRDVIDRSYSVSWMLFFKNKADQDSYQVDPIHLKFVEENSSLWSKVVVYDSEDI
ncbi:Dabb family protein [Rubrolithibacter danxiaensis]|uniref:Dabb family protein n=1 Tax=Rubrolithibacter danxiaensis TaxID=3390805 RepID=UPI003BF82B96